MSDYGGYRAIIDEAKALADSDKQRQLVDCPLCGEVLAVNSRGEKACPLGHFRAPGGATVGSHG